MRDTKRKGDENDDDDSIQGGEEEMTLVAFHLEESSAKNDLVCRR